MARKEPAPAHSVSGGLGVARSKLLKPIAPPSARGGGLRVGRVVSVSGGRPSAHRSVPSLDAHAACSPEQNARGQGDAVLPSLPQLGGNQLSSVIQEDEQRMHEGLLEMLSAKLAKKEKENELLRRKQVGWSVSSGRVRLATTRSSARLTGTVQEAFDRQQSDLEDFLQRQQQETESVRAELTSANQELQRQLQLVQIQCDRVRVAVATSPRSSAPWLTRRSPPCCSTPAPDRERDAPIDRPRAEALAGEGSHAAPGQDEGATGVHGADDARAPALPARARHVRATTRRSAERPASAAHKGDGGALFHVVVPKCSDLIR